MSPSQELNLFQIPSPEEVEAYAETIDFHINGEAFVNFYTKSDWCIGSKKIKSWRHCVVTWKTKSKGAPAGRQSRPAARPCNSPIKREADIASDCQVGLLMTTLETIRGGALTDPEVDRLYEVYWGLCQWCFELEGRVGFRSQKETVWRGAKGTPADIYGERLAFYTFIKDYAEYLGKTCKNYISIVPTNISINGSVFRRFVAKLERFYQIKFHAGVPKIISKKGKK